MTRTTHARLALVINAMLLAAVAGTRAQAQDEAQQAQNQAQQAQDAAQRAQEELDRTPEKCVLMNRVARNVAASNSQVVFFIKGGTNYLNVLDTACQALKKGDTRLVFNYQTRSAKITRLCDTDGFTVERQTSRIGCALGQFIPITAEEAAALTAPPVAAPPASSAND
jgi:precorrin-6B methylase 2